MTNSADSIIRAYWARKRAIQFDEAMSQLEPDQLERIADVVSPTRSQKAQQDWIARWHPIKKET